MANAASDPKVLRIGVIQGGKVIEERVVRKRGTVTFGTDDKNTFVLTGSELPKGWPLFELKGNTYQLVFNENMEGRVSVDSANVDFAGLKSQNLAEKQGDRFRMTLSESSRGRVQFGPDLTILFHFVAAPPLAPKPELPMSVKGGIIKAIEPIFTSVLVASFLIHGAVAIMVKTVEPPPPPSMDDLRAVLERLSPKIEAPTIPVTTTATAVGVGPGTEAPVEKGTSKGEGNGGGGDGKPKGGGGSGKGKGGGGGIGDRAAIRSAVAGKGLLQLIGGRGGGGGGAVGSVFGAGSAISDDVGSAIQGTAGVGIADGSGTGVTRRGGGGGGTGGDGTGGGEGGSAAGIGDLATGGGGAVQTGAKTAAKIVARVQAEDVEAVDGKVDKKSITSTIKRRADAFQGCYETALKANSKLAGKLVVEFTIDETGKVTDASVVKDGLGSSDVSKCVIATLKRLRFPAPKDGEVTISNSFVFQPGSSG